MKEKLTYDKKSCQHAKEKEISKIPKNYACMVSTYTSFISSCWYGLTHLDKERGNVHVCDTSKRYCVSMGLDDMGDQFMID